uniref:Uncharacterized protein n=1 Tax=Oxytricha trifallax TaxID=94289 RepID=Q49I44_OXYTR|nr:unknown [Sterkiella histriomuscorum]
MHYKSNKYKQNKLNQSLSQKRLSTSVILTHSSKNLIQMNEKVEDFIADLTENDEHEHQRHQIIQPKLSYHNLYRSTKDLDLKSLQSSPRLMESISQDNINIQKEPSITQSKFNKYKCETSPIARFNNSNNDQIFEQQESCDSSVLQDLSSKSSSSLELLQLDQIKSDCISDDNSDEQECKINLECVDDDDQYGPNIQDQHQSFQSKSLSYIFRPRSQSFFSNTSQQVLDDKQSYDPRQSSSYYKNADNKSQINTLVQLSGIQLVYQGQYNLQKQSKKQSNNSAQSSPNNYQNISTEELSEKYQLNKQCNIKEMQDEINYQRNIHSLTASQNGDKQYYGKRRIQNRSNTQQL